MPRLVGPVLRRVCFALQLRETLRRGHNLLV